VPLFYDMVAYTRPCRLALQALVFGNARAIALLWTRFVHELRFRHWETLTPLPNMPGARLPAPRNARVAMGGPGNSRLSRLWNMVTFKTSLRPVTLPSMS